MQNTTFQIGCTETLKVLRETSIGVYLGHADGEDSVLLPAKQVPEGLQKGDEITVFLYRDSEDRPIATTRMPKAQLGEFAYLEVKSAAKVGAFLDWGLEKDLFVPFQEQEERLKAHEKALVYLYLDRSGRLCGTTRVYDRLSPAEYGEFKREEPFSGIVYRVEKNYGVFVAVYPKEPDKKRMIFGLVPAQQVFRTYHPGEEVSGRIARIRKDGKLDLSVRARDFEQIAGDAGTILKKMEEYGGMLPFSENASPEIIRRELKMSKNGFKKALGSLLKAGKIRIETEQIILLPKKNSSDPV